MRMQRNNWLGLRGLLLSGSFLTGMLFTAAAAAETIEVTPGQSIEAAIKQARPGDTVAVRAGTYNESIYAHASGVKVISADGVGKAHIVSRGTGIFLQGGSGTEIRGFRVTAGKDGNGIQVGGAAVNGVIRNIAENYVVADNIITNAGLDGIKVHQAKGFTFTGNVIENAGTGNKGNADGGIDFVSVTDSRLEGNTIVKTGGNSCVMLKGGTARNTITGNSFAGCKDAIHVGGFTGPRPAGFKEAHDNRITGNTLCADEMAFRLFDGEAARRDNDTSGNTINSGCATATTEGSDGGQVDTDNTDGSNNSSSKSNSDINSALSSVGTMSCSSGEVLGAVGVAANAVVGIFTGGRSTFVGQMMQQGQHILANICLSEQAAAQAKMIAGGEYNSAPDINRGMRRTNKLLGDVTGTNWGDIYPDQYGQMTSQNKITWSEMETQRQYDASALSKRAATESIKGLDTLPNRSNQVIGAAQASPGALAVGQANVQATMMGVEVQSMALSTQIAHNQAVESHLDKQTAAERRAIEYRKRMRRGLPGYEGDGGMGMAMGVTGLGVKDDTSQTWAEMEKAAQ